ncbi:MAG: methionine-S-sulfoxide reductase [bacterium]|jgi:methionine-S-sulfoxide reductase
MEQKKATFAGGCFWCMQPPFDQLEGVLKTIVGYIGGHTKDPTYQTICTGTTGHTEAIEILFDPQKISYTQLLNVFWTNINPTTLNQQFADIGTQYRTAIFYHSDEQQKYALASKQKLEESEKFQLPIVTEISPVSIFYKAEEHHQNYYQKESNHYNLYKHGSGRVAFLEYMKKN